MNILSQHRQGRQRSQFDPAREFWADTGRPSDSRVIPPQVALENSLVGQLKDAPVIGVDERFDTVNARVAPEFATVSYCKGSRH